MTRHIPNLLTCISLTCGFYAAILGLSGYFFSAMCALILAAIFDFSDGLAARLLKAGSVLGKELDSLSDIVSFGVAPGMMVFRFLASLLHSLSWNESIVSQSILLTVVAIPVFSAIRLAKFNIDDRQKTTFIGLPVPAHAIFWSSLIVVLSSDVHASFCLLPQAAMLLASFNPEIIIFALSLLSIVTSLLLISRIPMFSLKLSSLSWKANQMHYILLVSALLLFIIFGILGITLSILLYFFLSLSGFSGKDHRSKPIRDT